jgi:hypothetical protein
VQEEFRWNTRDGSSSKHDDEEDCSLTAKARKVKGKKSQSNYESKVKKLDLSKVKCFSVNSKKRTSIFEGNMPNLVGKF